MLNLLLEFSHISPGTTSLGFQYPQITSEYGDFSIFFCVD